jgi:hypothetical protein
MTTEVLEISREALRRRQEWLHAHDPAGNYGAQIGPGLVERYRVHAQRLTHYQRDAAVLDAQERGAHPV